MRHTALLLAVVGGLVVGQATATGAAPPPRYGASVLRTGASLTEAGELDSPHRNFLLFVSEGAVIMQQEIKTSPRTGHEGRFLWTAGAPAFHDPPPRYLHAKLTMQDNGNLVLRDRYGHGIWQTHTGGTGRHNRLFILDSGRLAVRTDAGQTVWHSPTQPRALPSRQRLMSGESLGYGNNGMIKSVTRLTMQTNGRLVLTIGRTRIWTSPDGPRGSYLELTRHDDLILYSPAHRRVWHTHTGGHHGGYLLVCKGGFNLYALGVRPIFSAGSPQVC